MPSLAANIVAPCAPISRLTSMLIPSFRLCDDMPLYTTSPTPVVLIKILSTEPFGTTLVSPLTMIASLIANSFFIDLTIFSNSLVLKPSSMMTEHVRYFGLAPIIAKSLQVPQILSLPISPPAKKSGLTVKLSVVIAILDDVSRTAASSLWLNISFLKAL